MILESIRSRWEKQMIENIRDREAIGEKYKWQMVNPLIEMKSPRGNGSFRAIEMEDKDFLSGSWEDFETWIKAKVGGEISWKIRPRDTRGHKKRDRPIQQTIGGEQAGGGQEHHRDPRTESWQISPFGKPFSGTRKE
jgi:hypothetical protein